MQGQDTSRSYAPVSTCALSLSSLLLNAIAPDLQPSSQLPLLLQIVKSHRPVQMERLTNKNRRDFASIVFTHS